MIRWGIIGCGDVTEVKSGPAFAKAEGSALVAVMRRTASLAEDYARRHGVPRWYADAEALVTDTDVDAVYVATPPDAHREHTRLVARHRKPVYVEKPMAMNHGECLDMIDACRASGAQAVHPGYGFLSESAEFSRACRDAGLIFVGPTPEAIESLGNKAAAKQLAQRIGI